MMKQDNSTAELRGVFKAIDKLTKDAKAACVLLAINPGDLFVRDYDSFNQKGLSDVRQKIRFEHFQEKRTLKIKAVYHLIKKCSQPKNLEGQQLQSLLMEIKEKYKEEFGDDEPQFRRMSTTLPEIARLDQNYMSVSAPINTLNQLKNKANIQAERYQKKQQKQEIVQQQIDRARNEHKKYTESLNKASGIKLKKALKIQAEVKKDAIDLRNHKNQKRIENQHQNWERVKLRDETRISELDDKHKIEFVSVKQEINKGLQESKKSYLKIKKMLEEESRSREKMEANYQNESIYTFNKLDSINSKLNRAEQNKTMHNFWVSASQKKFQDPLHESVYVNKAEKAFRNTVMKELSLKKRIQDRNKERQEMIDYKASLLEDKLLAASESRKKMRSELATANDTVFVDSTVMNQLKAEKLAQKQQDAAENKKIQDAHRKLKIFTQMKKLVGKQKQAFLNREIFIGKS